MTIGEKELLGFRKELQSQERSDATIEKYMRDTRKFVQFTAGTELTKEKVIAYKNQLIKEGYALRSINSMVAAVNSFLNYLELPQYRVARLAGQRSPYRAETEELNRSDYEKLLRTAFVRNRKIWTIMQVICSTGIRVSELRFFTAESVRSGEVNVRCKNKTRPVLLPSRLRALLRSYMRENKVTTGAIFINRSGMPLRRTQVWAQMKRLCGEAGVAPEKVFPHNLRKLFACTFYEQRQDISKLADVLGHSSIDTTRIYIKTTCREHQRIIDSLNLVYMPPKLHGTRRKKRKKGGT